MKYIPMLKCLVSKSRHRGLESDILSSRLMRPLKGHNFRPEKEMSSLLRFSLIHNFSTIQLLYWIAYFVLTSSSYWSACARTQFSALYEHKSMKEYYVISIVIIILYLTFNFIIYSFTFKLLPRASGSLR